MQRQLGAALFRSSANALKEDILISIADLAVQITRSWITARNLLIKYYYVGEPDILFRVTNRLDDIANSEERLFDEFQLYVGKMK